MSSRVDRLRPRPDKALVARLQALIAKVSRRMETDRDCDAEVAEINALSGGNYTATDFQDLESWTSPREAAKLAASGGPVALHDLTRAELIEMVEAIASAKEPTATHFLRLLEGSFPQSHVVDLLYYPHRRELTDGDLVDELLLRHELWRTGGVAAVRAHLFALAGEVLADPQAAPFSRQWAESIVGSDGLS